jgi:hypothetical protein
MIVVSFLVLFILVVVPNPLKFGPISARNARKPLRNWVGKSGSDSIELLYNSAVIEAFVSTICPVCNPCASFSRDGIGLDIEEWRPSVCTV